MKDKRIEEFLEKAKRMQEENPEEFAKQVEKVKEQWSDHEGMGEKLRELDEDKREKVMELFHQAQSLQSTTPEERAKRIQEMKDKLSPEDQSKLQRAAKLLKGMLKNK